MDSDSVTWMRGSGCSFSLRPARSSTARRGGGPERTPSRGAHRHCTGAPSGVSFHWWVIWARGYRGPSEKKSGHAETQSPQHPTSYVNSECGGSSGHGDTVDPPRRKVGTIT